MVFLSLTGQDKHAVRNISVEISSSTNIAKFVIEELNKLCLKDERSLVYEADEKFEKICKLVKCQ